MALTLISGELSKVTSVVTDITDSLNLYGFAKNSLSKTRVSSTEIENNTTVISAQTEDNNNKLEFTINNSESKVAGISIKILYMMAMTCGSEIDGDIINVSNVNMELQIGLSPAKITNSINNVLTKIGLRYRPIYFTPPEWNHKANLQHGK